MAGNNPDHLENIRYTGWVSVGQLSSAEYERERDRNRVIYGSDLMTSSFICRTMGLDIPENRYGDYDRVVKEALERINEEKTEIHFTPFENNVYRKLRFIYDKIVSDTKNHICNMLKLRETPELCKIMTNQQVIEESSRILREYGIKINEDLKNGEKIKYIEDKINELRKSGRISFGGNKRSKKINKSKRKNKSKRRNKSKRYKK